MNRNDAQGNDGEAFLLFFSHLQSDTATTLIDTYKEYLAGNISITQLQQAFVTTLKGAHVQAAHLGRRMAGVTDPLHPADEAFAQTVMFEQARYLSGLISDIRGGRYPSVGEAVNSDLARRIRMYADRLLGTFNATWRLALPVGTMLDWVLGVPETNHCQTCPQRAAGGPYDAHLVTFDPGDGTSECGVLCLCRWQIVGGASGPTAARI